MARRKVVILGAGFGGVFAARELRRLGPAEVDVELIDGHNYFVFQPLLPEVAAGSVDAADAVTPLRILLPGVTMREAEIVGIDFERRVVQVVQNMRRSLVDVPYDHLVVALGQATDLARFPGLAEHAFTMKDLADAIRLRNHVIDCLEQANIADDSPTRAALLTFVVIGGGLSGVEIVGEVEDMIARVLKFYPRLRRAEVRIVLAERLPAILPELSPGLAAYAARQLQRRGIEIFANTGVKSAAADSVELADGRVIRSRTIVATIGAGPWPLIAEAPLPKTRGKIVVDAYLRVPGLPNVWACGDAALVPLAVPTVPSDPPPTFAPPTAQAAVQQARRLAANLLASILGDALHPVTVRTKGQLASLGGRRGVATVFGVDMAGYGAWVLWRWAYLAMLPGLGAKIRVGLDRVLDWVLPRNIVQLQQPRPPAVRRQRFRAGDVVFRRGEATGPFYIVLSGAFVREAEDRTTPEHPIGPGGQFGEGVLLGERTRRTTVKAVDDSLCLLIERDDFALLASAYPGLKPYFDGTVQRRAG